MIGILASQGTALSRTVANIPTGGRTLEVLMWSRFADGRWESNTYTLKAATLQAAGQ